MQTRAFGMDVDAGFAMPGVADASPVGDGRELLLRLGDLSDVQREFAAGAERIAELRFDDGRLAVSVDAAGDRGYLAYAFDCGHVSIAADGRTAVVSPLDEPPWVWQRYITGQVLPLAAVLQGLEVFHACVLGLDGQAVAVVARSGMGKTTLALQLMLRGLRFLSDDVLVVEAAGDGVRVHPGIGLANVRPRTPELVAAVERAGLGTAIGVSERETRISLRRADEPQPLAALFVLRRYQKPRDLRVERLSPVDPRLLLASSFNFSVRRPERLARQLDVCARIARASAVFGVSCGSETASADVSDAVLEHASRCIPC